MPTNIDMTRILSVYGVDRHRDTREVVFINKSWLSLRNAKIAENSTYVDNFLSAKLFKHMNSWRFVITAEKNTFSLAVSKTLAYTGCAVWEV